MRDLRLLDIYRLRTQRVLEMCGSYGDHETGCFLVKSGRTDLLVIATTGMGWDHVSVSTKSRCPSWDEMEYIKRLFFREDETAMQLHVPASEHVNCHTYCLHLWRPTNQEIPRPPSVMVGPKSG